jgi:transcription initiation factor TFIIB
MESSELFNENETSENLYKLKDKKYKNNISQYSVSKKKEGDNMSDNTKSHKIHNTTCLNKTIKKKKSESNKINKVNKNKIWEIYDIEKSENSNNLDGVVNCEDIHLCNVCSSILIIMDDGFPTCSNVNCGVIYRNTLDYSPEWRFYGAEDKNTNDPSRCGNPINPLLLESSFGCKILCSAKSSYEMKKISKWTEWQSMPHKEKSLYEEFQFITIMAQNSGIPKIFIDNAISIHKDISEQKMFRGLNRDGIKAASIYISCRLNGCPRTAHEISEIFKLDKTSATNGCSTAVNILNNIERSSYSDDSTTQDLCMTTPSSFIERYCSKLNINTELTMVAKFIANKVEKQNIIMDNTPHAIASGIVFFISQNCNLNISKIDIKQICGVSEVTINKCYKKLEAIKSELLPSCIIDKYNI